MRLEPAGSAQDVVGSREGREPLPLHAARPEARWFAPFNGLSVDPTLKYLACYPPDLRAQIRALIVEGRLSDNVQRRYPGHHDIGSDGALYEHVQECG